MLNPWCLQSFAGNASNGQKLGLVARATCLSQYSCTSLTCSWLFLLKGFNLIDQYYRDGIRWWGNPSIDRFCSCLSERQGTCTTHSSFLMIKECSHLPATFFWLSNLLNDWTIVYQSGNKLAEMMHNRGFCLRHLNLCLLHLILHSTVWFSKEWSPIRKELHSKPPKCGTWIVLGLEAWHDIFTQLLLPRSIKSISRYTSPIFETELNSMKV